jgi:hypothetical protein
MMLVLDKGHYQALSLAAALVIENSQDRQLGISRLRHSAL